MRVVARLARARRPRFGGDARVVGADEDPRRVAVGGVGGAERARGFAPGRGRDVGVVHDGGGVEPRGEARAGHVGGGSGVGDDGEDRLGGELGARARGGVALARVLHAELPGGVRRDRGGDASRGVVGGRRVARAPAAHPDEARRRPSRRERPRRRGTARVRVEAQRRRGRDPRGGVRRRRRRRRRGVPRSRPPTHQRRRVCRVRGSDARGAPSAKRTRGRGDDDVGK